MSLQESSTTPAPAGITPEAIERMLTPPRAESPSTRKRAHAGMRRLSFTEYQKHPALSRSTLDKIMVSPRHLRHYVEHGDEDSTAFTQGRVLHTLLLEPAREAETIAVFTGKVRNGKAWDEFKAAANGKDIVTQAEYERLQRMRDAGLAKLAVRSLLERATLEGAAFWTDPATNVECKARPDVVSAAGICEVKTAADITPEGFTRAAFNYGYHRQAAWYLDGLTAATGRTYDSFAIIVLEKDEPFEVRLVQFDAASIERGRAENRRNLDLYASCLMRGEWPGYPDVIDTLALPRWLQ